MRFDRILRVTPLQDEPQKKTFYNEDLRGYIESPHTYLDYEVEIEKARCYFDDRYYKLQDFYRRITYRYDWMKFRIDTNGKHEVLDNFIFLQKNWSELDNMLHQDYVGVEVDLFLKQISNDFKDKQVFENTMNTYFYYGLLFPPIPKHHNTEWLKLRKVLISDNSSIILKETIRFVSENEKTKTYQIEAQSISPAIDLISFSGKIELLKENNLVEKVLIDLQYKNRIINAWTFSIEILKQK